MQVAQRLAGSLRGPSVAGGNPQERDSGQIGQTAQELSATAVSAHEMTARFSIAATRESPLQGSFAMMHSIVPESVQLGITLPSTEQDSDTFLADLGDLVEELRRKLEIHPPTEADPPLPPRPFDPVSVQAAELKYITDCCRKNPVTKECEGLARWWCKHRAWWPWAHDVCLDVELGRCLAPGSPAPEPPPERPLPKEPPRKGARRGPIGEIEEAIERGFKAAEAERSKKWSLLAQLLGLFGWGPLFPGGPRIKVRGLGGELSPPSPDGVKIEIGPPEPAK